MIPKTARNVIIGQRLSYGAVASKAFCERLMEVTAPAVPSAWACLLCGVTVQKKFNNKLIVLCIRQIRYVYAKPDLPVVPHGALGPNGPIGLSPPLCHSQLPSLEQRKLREILPKGGNGFLGRPWATMGPHCGTWGPHGSSIELPICPLGPKGGSWIPI